MKILVLYYSMYGNVFKLAQAVAEGAKKVEGSEVSLKTVPELVAEDIIEKSPGAKKAKEQQEDIPVATLDDLGDADGVIFGSPTRFGNMCAQLRQFLDQTGELWQKGALIGKPAGFFCSTSTVHGGQETTLVSMMLTAIHHGMLVVGIPYSEQRLLTTKGGGSPYGASSVSGMMSDQLPTEDDLELAFALGKRVAEIAKKLKS
ncbi:MAG: NAD(P)H-quinone oxidoreductase [candidate division Zixibacteria bacterium SM23_73_2]|nr:MAG: NAD(P)H-quinone oxidoreductase [candidate division Zixibacteria bacterium SM23_73_2]